jgi:hypothetical protein
MRKMTYLFEVGTSSKDLMNEIFNGEYVVFAKSLLDDSIVRKRDALLIDLAVSTLVDQLTDRLEVGLSLK